MQADDDSDNIASLNFDIEAKYCPMTLPSSLQSQYSFDLADAV